MEERSRALKRLDPKVLSNKGHNFKVNPRTLDPEVDVLSVDPRDLLLKESYIAKDQIEALRERSGRFHSRDPLTSLFYSLLRDHIPASTLETLIQEEVEVACHKTGVLFTNGFLARYAEDCAKRVYRLVKEVNKREQLKKRLGILQKVKQEVEGVE